MKVLSALLVSISLAGCAVYAQPPRFVVAVPSPVVVAPVVVADEEVVYEPDVILGAYYVGFWRPGFGYWTGYGWDFNFYAYGHGGYGHYYRGAPRSAFGHYRGGPHYRGGRVGGHFHR